MRSPPTASRNASAKQRASPALPPPAASGKASTRPVPSPPPSGRESPTALPSSSSRSTGIPCRAPSKTDRCRAGERRGATKRELVPEVGARIDGLAAHENLVVQVRPRRASGVAGPADEAAALDALPRLDVQPREVAVQRADVLAVVDDDRVAVFLVQAGQHHGAVGRRVDRGATLGADVHAAVELEPRGPRRVAGAVFG